MPIPETLLQVQQYEGEGYQPLVDYGAWRVAMLRYIDELRPENLARLQRHEETDEVFVLLGGRCILFLGEGDAEISQLYAVDMQPFKLYNVRRNCWHTHTLSADADVLIVENRDTTAENSPQMDLTPEQRAEIVAATRQLWGASLRAK